MLEPIEGAMAAGKWNEAADMCIGLIAEHPTTAKLYAYLGWCYAQLGRPVDSVEPLRKAVILEPHFWQASFQLAQLLDKMGRYAEALQHARDALKDKPGFTPIESLIRGLERQVPDKITDAWQVSAKPLFYTVQITHHEEPVQEKPEPEETSRPMGPMSPQLSPKPGSI
jgi:tetratricopeptide (TPR) repeat protein